MERLTKEIGRELKSEYGTEELYHEYIALMDELSKTGKKYKACLNPSLLPFEGKKIKAEVYGNVETFTVGRSSGFLPIVLMVKPRKKYHESIGYATEVKNIQVIG
jgi:hypothetical protein